MCRGECRAKRRACNSLHASYLWAVECGVSALGARVSGDVARAGLCGHLSRSVTYVPPKQERACNPDVRRDTPYLCVLPTPEEGGWNPPYLCRRAARGRGGPETPDVADKDTPASAAADLGVPPESKEGVGRLFQIFWGIGLDIIPRWVMYIHRASM